MMKSALASWVQVDSGASGGRVTVVICSRWFSPDVGLFANLLDEILRHAGGEAGAAHEHDDLGGVTGVENGGLSGGVAAADDEDAMAGYGDAVKARCPVDNAAAEEAIVTFEFEPMPGDTRGQQDDTSADAVAAVKGDAVAVFE
jgi:hypothetical protein